MAVQRINPGDQGAVADTAAASAQGGSTDLSSAQQAAPAPRVRASALREELAALTGVVPVPALLDTLLERAFEMNATDLHFDPHETRTRVRMRVDGMLQDVLEVAPPLALQLASRLKLMASMDIAEKRLPQDGHCVHQRGGGRRDVRIATAPTAHGERVVLRLASGQVGFDTLEDLGMQPRQLELVTQLIAAPYGMILCVGPVGSGKTTTVYTCLKLLNGPMKSLASIEDPIEHLLPGVNQMQVDPRIGLKFATGLRALMRQDPDVALVGEIRDAETAHTAVRAALTGVLLLSTMHANDAASSIDVFHEYRVPPMLVGDALLAVLAQRLLRKLCTECREPVKPNSATRQLLGLDEKAEVFAARGCDACFETGYRGRTGIFEIMPVDRELRNAILRGAGANEIHDHALRRGMTTLESSAAALVRDGTTSAEEMHRVLAASLDWHRGAPGAEAAHSPRAKHEAE